MPGYGLRLALGRALKVQLFEGTITKQDLAFDLANDG
jgi:hypothetical protein